MKKYIMLAAFVTGSLCASAQYWNDTGNPAIMPGTNFLGTINSAPLDFRTDNVQRMRLLPTLAGQTVGTFTNENLSGNLGIGAFTSSIVNRPFSLLHLDNGGTQYSGYRPWFRPGMTITNGSDMAWIGLKNEGGDINHLTLAWADNALQDGPDLFKVVFLANPTTTGTAGTVDGLETMRILPAQTGLESNFGIGDWHTAGENPTERLDVLDGRVRIRQLPDDQEADNLNKFLVVDDSPSPSGERGVLKWRYLPPSSGSCLWNPGPSGSFRFSTAYQLAGTNGNCPDRRWKVGIGIQVPQSKLEVYHDEIDGTVSGGLRVGLKTNGSGWRYGVKSYVEPMADGNDLMNVHSINGEVKNAGKSSPLSTGEYSRSWGVKGQSTTMQDLYLSASTGVSGTAKNNGSATITEMLGGDFLGDNKDGVVTSTYGVRGYAHSTVAGATCYGVYGKAAVDTNSWAGYFQGKVRATNYMMAPLYYAFSDASIKTGVEDLEQTDVPAKLAALVPRRYHYTPEAQERFGLPAEEQFGFVAQEVEAVVPELVVVSRMPEELDSVGTVIYPEMEIKAVNYQELIPLLVQGYQQQQATIAQLQQQVAQCCAANQGMAPQDGPMQKDAQQAADLQEQRLLIIPNPVADLTTLEYYVPKAGRVSLSVSTSDGKPMGTLREEQAEAGAYSYQWNTTKLAAGTYFCTYLLDGAVVVKRAVKVK